MIVKKIREYLERVDDDQCCPPHESVQLWSDYLQMLKILECDLTDHTEMCIRDSCSTLLCEQMMTIGIELLQGKIGEVTEPETLAKIDRAIRCSLAL